MIEDLLTDIVGAPHIDRGDDVSDDVTHDEALGAIGVRPRAVVRPAATDEVAAIVRAAAAGGVRSRHGVREPDCRAVARRSRGVLWSHSSG